MTPKPQCDRNGCGEEATCLVYFHLYNGNEWTYACDEHAEWWQTQTHGILKPLASAP